MGLPEDVCISRGVPVFRTSGRRGYWYVAWLYLGTLVGAGFATGREVLRFFAAYGSWGLGGTLLAGVLFALAGAAVAQIAGRVGARNYREYYGAILPPAWAGLMDGLTSVFFFLVLVVSIAGMTQLASDLMPASTGVAPYAAGGLLVTLVLAGSTTALAFGRALGPVQLGLVLVLSLLTWRAPGPASGSGPWPGSAGTAIMPPWWVAALLYFAYNHALSLSILTGAARLTRREQAVRGAALGGLLLGFMLTAATVAILLLLPGAALSPFPLSYAAQRLGAGWSALYSLLLAGAMLTTAVAVLWALYQRYPNGRGLVLTAIVAAYAAARGTFATFIDVVYPFMGAAGMLMVAALVRAHVMGPAGFPPPRGE